MQAERTFVKLARQPLRIYCCHWQYPARTQKVVKKKGNNKDSRKGGLSVGREDPGKEVDSRYHRSKKPLECLAGYIWISGEVSVPVLAQQTALQLNLPPNLGNSQNGSDMRLDGRSLPPKHLGQKVFVLLHGPPDLSFRGCLNRYGPVVRL
jgi:hypothetical protein